MKPYVYIILVWLIVMSLVTFFVTAGDKKRAKRGDRRVPEKTLFLLAFLGGATGEWIAMQIFRHKTKHRSFVIVIPILMTVQVLGAALLVLLNLPA